jgi:Apea-like HEPN
MSYRVEDALTWVGNAAFESAAGTQIVNFVAALERLTTTETFSTHKFCSRVAMLGHEDEKDFEKIYWVAFEVHAARSGVVHGGFSPTSAVFQKEGTFGTRSDPERLVPGSRCIFPPRRRRQPEWPTIVELQAFFTKQQSKWASVLKSLQVELKAKKVSTF